MQGPYYAHHGYVTTDPASMFGDTSGVSLDGVSYPAIAPRPSMAGGPPGFAPVSAPEGFWRPGDVYTGAIQPYVHQPYTAISTAPISSFATPQPPDVYIAPNGVTESMGYTASNGVQTFRPATTGTSNISNTTPIQPTANTWPYSPVSTVTHVTQPSPAPSQTHFNLADTLPVQAPHHSISHQPSWQELPYTLEDGTQLSTHNVPGADRYLQPIQDATLDLISEQVQTETLTSGVPTQRVSSHQEPEDDWFDVESEDELAGAGPDISRYDLGMMIAKNAHQNNGDIRSMTNFLNEDNILSAYNPSYAASPLRDPQTARIFCHFITATGPTLHVCERHPSNPAVIFSGRPVPRSQQALWSYTLPMLALHHQGLLHAMLALSSLHIAKLQQTSPTPSLRHYHYALRRVAKALGSPRKRRDAATLAATLLLGFYEVTTAEHNKWNSHLSGARELVMDIPYAKLSSKVEAFRRRKEREEEGRRAQMGQSNGHNYSNKRSNDVSTLNDRHLDHDLLSTLMGWDSRHNEIGEVIEDRALTSRPEEPLSQKDVDEYELQLDLFWWFAKQDMYQSIISGNRLL